MKFTKLNGSMWQTPILSTGCLPTLLISPTKAISVVRNSPWWDFQIFAISQPLLIFYFCRIPIFSAFPDFPYFSQFLQQRLFPSLGKPPAHPTPPNLKIAKKIAIKWSNLELDLAFFGPKIPHFSAKQYFCLFPLLGTSLNPI